jgi:inner membrane protein
MPSPIGHTLAGCAVAFAFIPPGMPQAWEAWMLCLISANLPDVDFIPGLFTGNPRAFHRGPSHSVMAALIAAGLGASLLMWFSMPWLMRAELIFLAYGSHVALDYSTPGRGVLLGWPFWHQRQRASHPWFLSVPFGRTHQATGTRRGSRHLLRAFKREILLMSPCVVVLALLRGLSWLSH